MAEEINLLSILRSEDPLSDNAIQYLIEHKEEDRLVDYKEAFDPNSEKAWLSMNIDVTAFANTYGGFLVLGIKDKTYEILGLHDEALRKLADIKVFLEKLNRYIQPKLTSVRSKVKEINSKRIVVIYIPQSKQKTHIFTTNADIKQPSGKIETFIKQGAIYIRKSGSNQLVTADDFEELLQRRFFQAKEKLLDSIARVVKADENQEVIIVSADKTGSNSKFRITDASEAIPVKGMSFTVTPSTEEEKLSAWIAINKGEKDNFPTPKALMEIYAKKSEVHFSEVHKVWLAYFSLVKGLPVFFYLQSLNKKDIFELLENTISLRHTIDRSYVLDVSVFFGKSIYDKLSHRLNEMRRHVKISGYPDNLGTVFKINQITNTEAFEIEANNLSADLILEKDQRKLYRLRMLDCGLYAPFNK